MIELVVGQVGQGKSLFAGRTVLWLCERNQKWFDRTGIQRRIATNMPISDWVLEKYPDTIFFWKTVEDIISHSDIDVIFDEVANKFDARNWTSLSDDVKRWLRHHDKDGIEIYANTQHFEAIDVQFRRLTNRLYVVSKFIGSGRPAATKPPIKRVWGIILYRQHNPKVYQHVKDTGVEVKSGMGFPSWFWMDRKLVSVYDTRFKIDADKRIIRRHIERYCPTCKETTYTHV